MSKGADDYYSLKDAPFGFVLSEKFSVCAYKTTVYHRLQKKLSKRHITNPTAHARARRKNGIVSLHDYVVIFGIS